MAKLTAVNFDPFSEEAPSKPKLVPVNHDPFAEENKGITASGVAKQFASGLGKGAVSLLGLPGDIASLAGKGGDYLREHGYLPEIPKDSIFRKNPLPTSHEVINAASNVAPILTRKPENTAEEYANTFGEFLPSALSMGGGAARNAIRYGLAPALTSETAGQLTKGSDAEPYARLIGGVTGAIAAPRIMSPIRQNPDIAGHVARLDAEGIPLTAGQRTGNKALQWVESTAMDNPLSGANAEDFARNQGQAINRALTRRMGYEQPIMDTANWQPARERLNREFDRLTNNNTANLDHQLANEINNHVGNYNNLVPQNQRAPIVEQWEQNILNRANPMPNTMGQLSGAEYQAWRSQLKDAEQNARGYEQTAIRNIRRSLDSAMERSIRPQDQGAFRQAQQEWSALKTLQNAGTRAGSETAKGYLSPAAVRSEVQNYDPLGYLEGRNNLGELAKSIEAVKPRLPQSGTQPRTQAQRLLSLGIPSAGAATGGFLAGLPGAILGAVLSEAVPGVVGRAVLSNPGQRWLAYQGGHVGASRNKALASALLGNQEQLDQ